MRRPKHEVGNNKEPPVIPARLVSAHNCDLPQCPACRLSEAHRGSPGSQRIRARPEFEMSIRREDLQPGDCISMDQCQARVPGRLPTAHGCEPTQTKYVGGTTFVDHSSGCIHVHHQSSLRSGDTIQGKHAFKQPADQCGIKFKSFHVDDHPFGEDEILEDIALQEQKITFS